MDFENEKIPQSFEELVGFVSMPIHELSSDSKDDYMIEEVLEAKINLLKYSNNDALVQLINWLGFPKRLAFLNYKRVGSNTSTEFVNALNSPKPLRIIETKSWFNEPLIDRTIEIVEKYKIQGRTEITKTRLQTASNGQQFPVTTKEYIEPDYDKTILKNYAESGEVELRRNAAVNSQTPVEVIDSMIAGEQDYFVLNFISLRPDLSDHTVMKLMDIEFTNIGFSGKWGAGFLIANNQHVYSTVLEKLTLHNDSEISRTAFVNPSLNVDYIHKVLANGTLAQRRRAVKNTSIDYQTLSKIVEDENEDSMVRFNAWSNPSLPTIYRNIYM